METLKIFFNNYYENHSMDPNWDDLAIGNQHAVDTVAKSVLTSCQSVQASRVQPQPTHHFNLQDCMLLVASQC